MKWVIFFLPLCLYGQFIDSLDVKFVNPNGSPTHGIRSGYSKLIVQSALKGIEFVPEFTKSGSQDFIVKSLKKGYEIHVNIRKLEKDREPGVYSNLLMKVRHEDFIDYNISVSLKPGMAYQIVINPKTLFSAISSSEMLDKMLHEIKLSIDQNKFEIARGQINSAKLLFEGNPEIRSYDLLILLTERQDKPFENMRNIRNFLDEHEGHQMTTYFSERMQVVEQKIYEDIITGMSTNNRDQARSLISKYLNIADHRFEYFIEIKNLDEEFDRMMQIKVFGATKTIQLTVNVSPQGMNLYIEGKPIEVERQSISKNVEQLKATFNVELFSLTEAKQIEWSLRDPKRVYDVSSFENYDDQVGAWTVSLNSNPIKEIPFVIEMSKRTMDTSTIIIGAAIITAGILWMKNSKSPNNPNTNVSVTDDGATLSKPYVTIGWNFRF